MQSDKEKTLCSERKKRQKIRKKKRIPKERDFRIFEEEMGCEFEKMFACPESKDYREHFNQVLVSILTKNNALELLLFLAVGGYG